jgi:hypothetical protein
MVCRKLDQSALSGVGKGVSALSSQLGLSGASLDYCTTKYVISSIYILCLPLMTFGVSRIYMQGRI